MLNIMINYEQFNLFMDIHYNYNFQQRFYRDFDFGDFYKKYGDFVGWGIGLF